MNAFEIMEAYRDLENMVNAYNEETGEMIYTDEDIQEYISLLREEKDTKLENIEYIKRENKAKIDALANEIKRLQARKSSLEVSNDRLIEIQDTLLGGEKLKTNKFTFSYRTSKSVEVPEEVNTSVPSNWINVNYTWDKKKIKEK